MKKILILGGSHRDIPLIKAAQELGYFVITLGARDYYIGHRYSDKKYLVDFNDLDAVKKIYKEENIDYILPGCGEESYLNTVALSEALNIGNFDTLEVAKLIHNKWRFKEFCLKHDISTPYGFYYHKELDFKEADFPLVIKPTNLSGGNGVKVVYNSDELQINIQKALTVSDEIFLEKYLKGDLIAYNVFLENQKIIYSFSGADKAYLNPYLVTTAYPISLQKAIETRLKNDIEKLARLLHLKDGMFHLQLIVENNTPYIIDVTRRIPGDLYPDLIEFCDGVQYSKAVVKSYLGCPLKNEFIKTKNEFIIRHVVMADNNGLYKTLYIDNTLKDKIIYRFDIIESETNIDDYLEDKIAILFIQTDKEIDNLHNLIYPIIKKEI